MVPFVHFDLKNLVLSLWRPFIKLEIIDQCQTAFDFLNEFCTPQATGNIFVGILIIRLQYLLAYWTLLLLNHHLNFLLNTEIFFPEILKRPIPKLRTVVQKCNVCSNVVNWTYVRLSSDVLDIIWMS